MEEMKWKDTESTTERVVERMETSMCSMEQMSFDAINITDSLVTLTSKAREYAATMKNGDVSERHLLHGTHRGLHALHDPLCRRFRVLPFHFIHTSPHFLNMKTR